MTVQIEQFTYDDAIVRKFTLVTFVWGVVGMLVGVIVALAARGAVLQLRAAVAVLRPPAPAAHQRRDLRLRRQRDLRRRLLLDAAAAEDADVLQGAERVPLLGLAADHRRRRDHPARSASPRARSTPSSSGRSTSPSRWSGSSSPINFFGTLAKRRERHLYVAIWFYIATIVTIAMLHIFNNLVVPAGLLRAATRSTPACRTPSCSGGTATTRSAFFLTTPFLGLMYYFLPKAAEPAGLLLPAVDHPLLVAGLPLHLGRPAPPALHRAARLGLDPGHALLADAVDAVLGRHAQRPADPARRLGQGRHGPGAQVLRRRHHLLRHVHLRGPAAVDQGGQRALALHRLDHRPRPRRRPRLGRLPDLRDDLLAAAAALPDRAVEPNKLAEAHFWLGTIGILLYIVAIYAAGLTQGLMWRAFDEEGYLKYADFVETTLRLIPMYWVRVIGGTRLSRRRAPARRQHAS